MMDAGKLGIAAAFAALTFLAGCQTQPYNNTRPAQPGGQFGSLPNTPQSPFDGDWMSTDGVAISRFNNGVFETLATDTGNKLAEGQYTQLNPNTVSISVTSLIRQTTTQVNCAMVTQTQLNCTSSAGQQFSLTRRATMSS